MQQYIGFDIGGTKCAVIAAEADWEHGFCRIIDRVQTATDGRLWQPVLEGLVSEADRFISIHNLSPAAAGISCGGPLDSVHGIILSPPNLPGWDAVPAASFISSQLGIPAFLQNDANACAAAEWKFGAGRGCSSLIFMTFGTGLGAGLILDGKLYEGPDCMAGEIGHIRLAPDGPEGYGKRGSFEGFCSGGGIGRLAAVMTAEASLHGSSSPLCTLAPEQLTAKAVAAEAEKGDSLALEIYRTSAEKLGEGLSVLIDILNPERIIIGSVFARSEQLFRKEMQSVINRETLEIPRRRCRIMPAELGDSIGDYAAIAAAEKACRT